MYIQYLCTYVFTYIYIQILEFRNYSTENVSLIPDFKVKYSYNYYIHVCACVRVCV